MAAQGQLLRGDLARVGVSFSRLGGVVVHQVGVVGKLARIAGVALTGIGRLRVGLRVGLFARVAARLVGHGVILSPVFGCDAKRSHDAASTFVPVAARVRRLHVSPFELQMGVG